MRDIAVELGALGPGRGAWFAIDVRDDGAPHLYGVAAFVRGELGPILSRALCKLGAALEGQSIAALTGWQLFAELGDATQLRPNLARVIAYGVKPWPAQYGTRGAADSISSGVLSLGAKTSSALVTGISCPICRVTTARKNRRQVTCGAAKCRQAHSRLWRAIDGHAPPNSSARVTAIAPAPEASAAPAPIPSPERTDENELVGAIGAAFMRRHRRDPQPNHAASTTAENGQ